MVIVSKRSEEGTLIVKYTSTRFRLVSQLLLVRPYLFLLIFTYLYVFLVCCIINTRTSKSCKTKTCCFSGGYFVYEHTNCSFTVRRSIHRDLGLRCPCNNLTLG